MTRTAICLIATLLLAAVPGAAQQPHWLLGTWQGRLENLPPAAKAPADRTLIVKQVAPNGQSARGDLIINGKPANLALKIEGDTVTFGLPGASGVVHQLTHSNGQLNGTWTIRNLGKTGPMWLKRQ